MQPSTILGLKITGGLIAFLCWFLRLYVARTHTRHQVVCHILFFCAVALEMTGIGISGHILNGEIAAMRRYGVDDTQAINGVFFTRGNLKLLFVGHLVYFSTTCVLKAAFLVFYSELYSRVASRRRYALYIATAVWALSYIAGFLLQLLWCTPVSDSWTPSRHNPRCPARFTMTVFVTLTGLSVLTDIALLIVPLLIISSLQLRKKELYALVMVFTIGLLSVVASCVRLAVIYPKIKQRQLTRETARTVMLWSCIETMTGIIAFSLPSFRYMVMRVFGRADEITGASAGSKGSAATTTTTTTTGKFTIESVRSKGRRSRLSGASEEMIVLETYPSRESSERPQTRSYMEDEEEGEVYAVSHHGVGTAGSRPGEV